MPVSGQTQVVGLIGWPVSHSFSPAMHNAAAAALGLDWIYVPLPVHPDAVETAVRGLPALGLRGANVTVPHKQAVMPHLDAIAPGARAIGAVNTIVGAGDQGAESGDDETTRRQDNQTKGYNTDWSGFQADLAALGVPVAERDCLVLGAGGSARAVAYALVAGGGRVQVLARRPEQAQRLVADLSPHLAALSPAGWLNHWPLAELATAVHHSTAPLIVNTTPLGMHPDDGRSVWPDDLGWPANAFAYDLVYNPRTTRFMQQAKAAGCGATNGLGMLVRQGAEAFRLWTGVAPDVDVMRAALD